MSKSNHMYLQKNIYAVFAIVLGRLSTCLIEAYGSGA